MPAAASRTSDWGCRLPRWVGIDYGTRRIGLAISDPGESIASPGGVLDGSGTAPEAAHRVADWMRRHEADQAVVGLPLNMDGSEGPQAVLSRRFAQALAACGVTVELWDERLSSFQADELMQSAGLSRTRQDERRDAIAAQVTLQSFLDSRRAHESGR